MRRSCRICEGCQRPLSTKARFHKCEPVKPKPTCLDCAAPVYRSGLRCGNCKPSLDLIRNEITQRRSGPCTDCNRTYAYQIMQFDHVRGPKVRNVMHMLSGGFTEAQIREELGKCELVCPTCHALRTLKRSQEGIVIPRV